MSDNASTHSSANLIDSDVVVVRQVTPGYLNVTITNGEQNLFDSVTFAGLHLMQEYVSDPAHGVKVFVLESGNPDFFVNHLDFTSIEAIPDVPGAQDTVKAWPGFSHWLSNSPYISIAKIRGRARGAGSELAIACDMRFASREQALLAQIEVGFGFIPGGGALEWLPKHVGRARALEIVLGAEDIDADTAALYGYVNRSIPDTELDEHVDALARRIASYLPDPLGTAKSIITRHQATPAAQAIGEDFGSIVRLLSTEATAAESARLVSLAGGSLVDAELDLTNLYGQSR